MFIKSSFTIKNKKQIKLNRFPNVFPLFFEKDIDLENVIKNPPSFPGEEVSKERILSVDYGKITAVLIEAIKEQQTQIEALKALLK